MAIFQRKNRSAATDEAPPKAILAAAVPLVGPEAERAIAVRQTAS